MNWGFQLKLQFIPLALVVISNHLISAQALSNWTIFGKKASFERYKADLYSLKQTEAA